MSSTVEALGDALAVRCLDLMEKTGDEDLANTISKLLGSASQGAQESFMTAFRVRRAIIKANKMLDDYEAKIGA